MIRGVSIGVLRPPSHFGIILGFLEGRGELPTPRNILFLGLFQEVGQLGGERGGELSMCSCSRGGKQLQAYGKGEGKP